MAAIAVAVGVAACGAAAPVSTGVANTGRAATSAPVTAKPVAKAAYPEACAGETDGKAGKWSMAETAWGDAETEASSNLGATFAFASVALDTLSPALDQSLSEPVSAADVSTYDKDLAAASKYVTGC